MTRRGLTLAEARDLGLQDQHPDAKHKRSKYRAVPTVYNGVRYASRAEAARAEALDVLVRVGAVCWWTGQPAFRLGCPENRYVADFLVVYQTAMTGELLIRVEDVKGIETPKFRRDKRLWASYGPCPLHIVRGGKVAEIITPTRPGGIGPVGPGQG